MAQIARRHPDLVSGCDGTMRVDAVLPQSRVADAVPHEDVRLAFDFDVVLVPADYVVRVSGVSFS